MTPIGSLAQAIGPEEATRAATAGVPSGRWPASAARSASAAACWRSSRRPCACARPPGAGGRRRSGARTCAADLARLGGVLEDRRVLPGGALEAVVLADQAVLEHHPVGAVALAVGAADLVDARRAGVDRARRAQLGVRRAGSVLPAPCLDGLDGLVLAEAGGVLEPEVGRPPAALLLRSALSRSSSPRGPGVSSTLRNSSRIRCTWRSLAST